jgi:hypothetical protein
LRKCKRPLFQVRLDTLLSEARRQPTWELHLTYGVFLQKSSRYRAPFRLQRACRWSIDIRKSNINFHRPYHINITTHPFRTGIGSFHSAQSIYHMRCDWIFYLPPLWLCVSRWIPWGILRRWPPVRAPCMGNLGFRERIWKK